MILCFPLRPACLWAALAVVPALVVGCGGGGRRPPAAPRDLPAAAAPTSVQALYESGRYREVLSRLSADAGPEPLWFAGQSNLRLAQPEEAARLFARLPAVGASPEWQMVSDLALALLGGDVEVIDRARAAAAAFPADPFVQFELGLAHVRRSDFAAAAAAFDRSAQAEPRFAYAYYNAALAYDRIDRADLMVARLETFQRLAPEAPERPEVEAILLAVRRR